MSRRSTDAPHGAVPRSGAEPTDASVEHAPRPGRRGLLLQMLRRDFSSATRNLYLNTFAGSLLVPGIARKFLYQAAGMRIESYVVDPHCRIDGPAKNISIGAGTYVNVECFLEGFGRIDIGKECAVGMQAMIITSDHLRDEDGRWDPDAVYRGVSIGDRVWIGARATILPGVTIGDDVIIGAGALVNRDCRAGQTYAGVPARRVSKKLESVALERDLVTGGHA